MSLLITHTHRGDIARLLLKLRKSRNLTVTELAQRSGVSQAMISKVERGTTDAG
ncbi:helix-turn-helix transcriptional regulator, partial [Escherichia coli]|nr:helix-turn-helix transcriptional regulator [Escherichia coli]